MTQIIKNKKLTRSVKLAIPLLTILIIAEISKTSSMDLFLDSEDNVLMTDKDIADVYEPINFTWSTNVEYNFGILIYGDGEYSDPVYAGDGKDGITHDYQKEGAGHSNSNITFS